MAKNLMSLDCPVGVTTTGVLHGKTSGIIQLNALRYQWAYNLWEIMLNNTWFPKEVDITNDINKYSSLVPSERNMYDKVLAQLMFMDGLQTNNTVDNVNPWVTAPEINMVLVRQSFEEALHSQSYAVMVDSISPNSKDIYELWRTDRELFEKNSHIFSIYERFASKCESEDEAKVYMIVANLCLEGIYFYSGFAAMYSLARSGKMLGSAQMIRFIQRDEITHLLLFTNLFNTIKKEFPQIFTKEVIENIYKIFEEAVKLEIKWGKTITKEGILGLNGDIIENFVKYLANDRLNAINFEPLFKDIPKENPLPWFNDFSKIKTIKTNFFEGNVAAYSKGSLDLDNF